MANMLNILLVEDSEEDAELLYLELRRGGLDTIITRVETADDFVSELGKNKWHLVICDYNLPMFSAPAALEILNQQQSGLPFIILSGAVAAKDVVTLLKAGAHDFIEKSDVSRLVPAIERELREVKVRKERQKAESTLKKLFRAVEQSPASVIITDENGLVEYVNPRYTWVTGYSRGDVVGKLPDILAGDRTSPELNGEIWKILKQGGEWRGEFSNKRKDGSKFWEYVTISPIKNDAGIVTNLLVSKEDITYRKETEEKLYRQANFDDLTQLPNRALMLDRLAQSLVRSQGHSKQVALMTIDLDNFKKVNDSLGHSVGDALLKETAQRLEGCISAGVSIGRVSGDEFAIVISDMAHASEAENVMRKVLDVFEQPFQIKEHEVFITVSAGITVFPEDGEDTSILFRNAEAAMGRAKEAGRNGFRFFTTRMNVRAEERFILEAGLRKALDKNQLVLFYQPIIHGESGKIAGAEALIRWEHPEKGLIPPDDFISLAEETGLILPIGKWVINMACAAIKQFHNAGFENMYVAVNVSPQQVWGGSLIDEVTTALKTHCVDAKYLIIEVTENVCLEDTQTTLNTLNDLSERGIKLSVDDFGTGYSSLSYLKRYPFNTLKIDRAFVKDIPQDKDDMALVDAMIAMAHSLGLKVVGEGVETKQHVEFLKKRKCDFLQGYYFSRPVRIEDFLSQKIDVLESS